MPIKLSTYIQAQRPIFAHTPADSGLAGLVQKHNVGIVCSSDHESEILAALKGMMEKPVSRANFELIREDLMGREQIEQLRRALTS